MLGLWHRWREDARRDVEVEGGLAAAGPIDLAQVPPFHGWGQPEPVESPRRFTVTVVEEDACRSSSPST
jgi:hypothetical protein